MDTIVSFSKKTCNTLLQTFPFLPLQTLRATKTWPLLSLHGFCVLAITCFSLRAFATSVVFLLHLEFQSFDIHLLFTTYCILHLVSVYIWFYLFRGVYLFRGSQMGFPSRFSRPKHHQLTEITKCSSSHCDFCVIAYLTWTRIQQLHTLVILYTK